MQHSASARTDPTFDTTDEMSLGLFAAPLQAPRLLFSGPQCPLAEFRASRTSQIRKWQPPPVHPVVLKISRVGKNSDCRNQEGLLRSENPPIEQLAGLPSDRDHLLRRKG